VDSSRHALAMIDRNKGLRAGVEKNWPGTAVQRCTVQKLRKLERHAPRHALGEVKSTTGASTLSRWSKPRKLTASLSRSAKTGRSKFILMLLPLKFSTAESGFNSRKILQ